MMIVTLKDMSLNAVILKDILLKDVTLKDVMLNDITLKDVALNDITLKDVALNDVSTEKTKHLKDSMVTMEGGEWINRGRTVGPVPSKIEDPKKYGSGKTIGVMANVSKKKKL